MTTNNVDTFSLASLRTQRKAAADHLAALDEAISAFEKLQNFGPAKNNGSSFAMPSTTTPGSFSNLSKYECSIILLQESGRPLKTKEIIEGMRNKGKKLDSSNPMTSLFSGLTKASERNNSKIKKLGNGTWGLVGRD